MVHRSGRVALGAGKVVVAAASVGIVLLSWYGWTTEHLLNTGVARDKVIVPPPVTTAPATSTTSPTPNGPGQDQNILLVGLDSRTDAHGNPLPQAVLDQLHAGPDDGEINTDTLIVVHVPGDGRAASAVSIPRDSYVEIAGGFGLHKINSAYAYGMNAAAAALRAQGITDAKQIGQQSLTAGRRNIVQTVQDFTGVTINHYAEINLYGFDQISQALGGVPVCLNQPVNDSYSGAHFRAGQQLLSGVPALEFVRQRHGLPNGDLDRERRQQAFLASAVHQMLSLGTLANPSTLDSVITAVGNSVVLDEGWDILRFAQQMQGIAGGSVAFTTIPIVNITYWTPADGDAVEVDPPTVRKFVAAQFADAPTTTATPPTSGVHPTTTTPPPTTSNVITADGVTCVN